MMSSSNNQRLMQVIIRRERRRRRGIGRDLRRLRERGSWLQRRRKSKHRRLRRLRKSRRRCLNRCRIRLVVELLLLKRRRSACLVDQCYLIIMLIIYVHCKIKSLFSQNLFSNISDSQLAITQLSRQLR